MSDAMRAETVQITGARRDAIEAYLAQPLDGPPTGGVVVIHHMPGYDEGTKEITRRFAAHGYLAICPNLYSREAPGASPDDAAAAARAQGGVPDRAPGRGRGRGRRLPPLLPVLQRQGGHHRLLLGRPPVVPGRLQPRPRRRRRLLRRLRHRGRRPKGSRSSIEPIVDLAADLSCPLLGLFGAEDQYPSPEEVAELEEALAEAGKEFEFHSYEGAGHAFFATDRPSYRPEAANEGWERIWEFFGRNLASR